MKSRKTIIVFILLFIAGIFIMGAGWADESFQVLFSSYFADLAIPFGYYFLLILLDNKFRPLEKWYVKAGAAFLLCAMSETLQYFGIYALATVFDPWDLVMYAAGVLSAAFMDRVIFKRVFSFWV